MFILNHHLTFLGKVVAWLTDYIQKKWFIVIYGPRVSCWSPV